MNLREFVDKYLHLSQEKPLTLFAGAGISFDSGIATVGNIKHEILSRLPFSPADYEALMNLKFPFESLMGMIKESAPIEPLYGLFASDSPGPAHAFASQMAKAGLLGHVFTTNFDLLFEKAFAALGMEPQIIPNYKYFKLLHQSSSLPSVIKLHGSIDDAKWLGITIDEVANQSYASKLDPVMQHLFKSAGPIVFTGYSCSDHFDINPLLMKYGGMFDKGIFLVSHNDRKPFAATPFSRFPKTIFGKSSNAWYVRCNTKSFIDAIALKYLNNGIDPVIVKPVETTSSIIRSFFEDNLSDQFDTYRLAGAIASQLPVRDAAQAYYKKANEIGTKDRLKSLGNRIMVLAIDTQFVSVEENVAAVEQILNDPVLTPDLRIRCYNILCRGYIKHSDFFAAIKSARKSHKLAIKYGKPSDRYQATFLLSSSFGKAGYETGLPAYFNLAIKYMLRANQICTQYTMVDKQATTLLLCGFYYKQLKQPRQAFSYFKKAYAIAWKFQKARPMLTAREQQLKLLKKTPAQYPRIMDFLVEVSSIAKGLGLEKKHRHYMCCIKKLKQMVSGTEWSADEKKNQ